MVVTSDCLSFIELRGLSSFGVSFIRCSHCNVIGQPLDIITKQTKQINNKTTKIIIKQKQTTKQKLIIVITCDDRCLENVNDINRTIIASSWSTEYSKFVLFFDHIPCTVVWGH